VAFPDLRIHRAGLREESFWPSFTDIMMVIVMIFLMAMLGLLLRNMDLVSKLQLALTEAQHASQQVERASSTNQDLSSRLAQSEHDLEMMRAQLMDVSGQRKQLDQQLLLAKALETSWQQKAVTVQHAYQQLQSDKKLQNEMVVRLHQQLQQSASSAENEANRSAQQLQQVQQQLQRQGIDMARMKTSLVEQGVEVQQVRDDYSELSAQYRRLIRPARSSLGRVVVTVRYLRRDQQLKIAIQPPDKEKFIDVDGVQLHQMLSQLKTKLNHKLYVRILFPKDSGLSYNEAWRITESLLRLYDYYYQK